MIYSVSCRDKVTYYSRRYTRNSERVLIKSNEFLALQLKFSIINSIYLILYGVVITIFNLKNGFVIVGIFPFHLINFILILESKKKGYITYKACEIIE
jgi:hypothetical protein